MLFLNSYSQIEQIKPQTYKKSTSELWK